MKKIALKVPHSIKYEGAVGIHHERKFNIELIKRLGVLLAEAGDNVKIIEVNNPNLTDKGHTQEACRIANVWGADILIDMHSNAFADPGANGTEYIVYSDKETLATKFGDKLLKNMQDVGFRNRGRKVNNGFWVLYMSNMPCVIVESHFVTNQGDCDRVDSLGIDRIARIYGNALNNRISLSSGVVDGGGVNIPPKEDKPITGEERAILRGKQYVGARCKELQTKLIKLGYNCGGFGADGQFGAGTYKSLIQFQKDFGLVVDGLAGPNTFNVLDQQIAKKEKQYYLIKRGSKGALVRECQQLLISRGYSVGSAGADGDFGLGTETGVKNFQRANGLIADGIVGKNTWGKLLG